MQTFLTAQKRSFLSDQYVVFGLLSASSFDSCKMLLMQPLRILKTDE